MSKTAKILTATLAGIVVICACAFFGLRHALRSIASRVFIDDPVRVRELATSLLPYQLPPGYEETVAFQFLLGTMVMIGPPTPDSTPSPDQGILLLHIPDPGDVSAEEVRAQIQLSMARNNRRHDYDLHLVGESDAQIGGQTVGLFTYEGSDSQGDTMRWLFTDLLERPSGAVMVVFIGPVDQWDQGAVDFFLGSIK